MDIAFDLLQRSICNVFRKLNNDDVARSVDIFALRDDKLIDRAVVIPKHAHARHPANRIVRIHLTYSTLRHVARMIHSLAIIQP